LRIIGFYPLLILTMIKALLEGGILRIIECRWGADHGGCRGLRRLVSFVNVHLGCWIIPDLAGN
jgi:hypothetical protein